MGKATNVVFVLLVVFALLFGLLIGISNVNHGNKIRELEDKVVNLEKQIENVKETTPKSILNAIAALEDKLTITTAIANALKVGDETTYKYISDLQEQIDYLRRWAENQGYNPSVLYDDPDVTTPDEWSEYNDEYDEYDEGDEIDL